MTGVSQKIFQSTSSLILLCALIACSSGEDKTVTKEIVEKEVPKEVVVAKKVEPNKVESQCLADMKKLKGREQKLMQEACRDVAQLPNCVSVKGKSIYHYDRPSKNAGGKRILAFALIHGDEGPSGTVARAWMERLSAISPQNHWRVVPILNPDGWEQNTRTNSHKIDLNRNFPTKNWKKASAKRWRKKKFDPRRFPGKVAASEPETVCAIDHIDDFNPSFIISIHTPYGVLDFDGPRMKFPSFNPLPWFSLGNYPGSMGRYMWAERRVPVLTIELKGNDVAEKLEQFDRLQDITGIVAIQSEKILTRKKKKSTATKRKKRFSIGFKNPKKVARSPKNSSGKL